MARYLYSELAKAIEARKNCIKANNQEWLEKHTETIKKLQRLLPSGSGLNCGTSINLDISHAEKIVLRADYQHMNDAGYYSGWTYHTIMVTPSFSGINLRISGRDRNRIKDYLYETFDYALTRDVTYEILVDMFPQFKLSSVWENEDGTPSQCYQAWYVGEYRFWNKLDQAKQFAAAQMQIELNKQ